MSYTEKDRLEASEWFIDIHDIEDPSPDLLHDWMRWLEASEGHRLAFSAVERAWRDAAVPLSSIASANDSPPDQLDYDGSVSVHAWRSRLAVAKGSLWTRGLAHRRWLGLAAAAAICTVALVMTPRLRSHFGWAAAVDSFATRTGEHMQVTLPDGSQVNLGARSKLSIDYTRNARDVRLEFGEAFFAVQKDATRPFRVHVLDGIVTAVGTAFDVRATNDRVLVTVAEGTVQVTGSTAALPRSAAASLAPPDTQAHPVARLRRGEAADFVSHPENHTLEATVVTRVDPAAPARWREGWLVYRDEPLRNVLADIGRYTDRNIVIAQSLSPSPHFTGAVYKDSIIEWLESLPNAFPVTVTVDGAHIVIAPASNVTATRVIQ
jgi:transmembrane sensor